VGVEGEVEEGVEEGGVINSFGFAVVFFEECPIHSLFVVGFAGGGLGLIWVGWGWVGRG